MPLSINFRWNVPQLDKPEPEAIRSGWKSAMNDIGETGRYLRTRADSNEQKRIAEEDRQRRIAEEERQKTEEERQKKLYGDAANSIRGKVAERAALVKRRDEIKARIAELKGTGNG
jgi:hypothetical protein